MYLREQLKAIQKELGDDDEPSRELAELREKLAKLDLPKEARAEVERELGRLGRSGRESMDAQVIRTYLEWIAELPWNTPIGRRPRPQDGASSVLDEDHYGLKDVKDRVLEFLAVRQLRAAELAARSRRRARSRPTQLKDATERDAVAERRGRRAADHRHEGGEGAGDGQGADPALRRPAGRGQDLDRQVDRRALGREYVRVSLGGVRDEADIRGHRRTYVGAMPGRIIQGMKQAGTKNPVFLLDEVDKLGVSFQGDPASALLEVLDPAQNDTFTDHYLNVPVRPERGAVHRHGELHPEHPRPAAGPDGGRRVLGLHRAREGRDREEVPDPAPARGVGAGRPGASRSPTRP